MDVQVVLLEELGLLREAGLYEGLRDGAGLLHDVTELSGDNRLAAALREEAFDVEDLAADLGPGEAGDDARLGGGLHLIMWEGVHVEEVAEVLAGHLDNRMLLSGCARRYCRRNGRHVSCRLCGRGGFGGRLSIGRGRSGGRHVSFRLCSRGGCGGRLSIGRSRSGGLLCLDVLHRGDTAEGVEALLQATDAAFTRIVRDDRVEDVIRKRHIPLRESDILQCLREEVPLRDLELLARGVALELDDLHTVQQRRRDRVEGVRGADEEHVTEIIRYVHVVIGKGIVLLRIEDLEKGARRITVEGARELVDLVEHHDRIRHAGLRDAIHDTTRHRADIGTTVAADIRLIAYATEGNAHVLAVQRLRDGLADRGLTGTRGTDKDEDGAGLGLPEIHHRDLLDDTLLHLLHAEMLLIEDLLGLGEIDGLRRFLLPGKAGHEIEIIVEHAGLGGIGPVVLHTIEDLRRFSLRLLVHAGFLDLQLILPGIGNLLRVHLVELVLEIVDLPTECLLLIRLLIVLLLRRLGVGGHLRNLGILIDDLLEALETLLRRVLLQQAVALLVREGEP